MLRLHYLPAQQDNLGVEALILCVSVPLWLINKLMAKIRPPSFVNIGRPSLEL
jgi:hypothetical protein